MKYKVISPVVIKKDDQFLIRIDAGVVFDDEGYSVGVLNMLEKSGKIIRVNVRRDYNKSDLENLDITSLINICNDLELPLCSTREEMIDNILKSK